jgi:hypothetical protein
MSVVPLSLDPNAEARALLNFMLQHGNVVGTDYAGRLLHLAVDPSTLDQLASMPKRRTSKIAPASRTALPSSSTWLHRSKSAGHPASCKPWRSLCCS